MRIQCYNETIYYVKNATDILLKKKVKKESNFYGNKIYSYNFGDGI